MRERWPGLRRTRPSERVRISARDLSQPYGNRRDAPFRGNGPRRLETYYVQEEEVRILFLDDDENRHTHAMRELIGHDVHHVRTVGEAVARLKANDYDLAMLDHDLGGTHYAPSNEVSGYAVALAIESGEVRRPARVVVHSFNAAGATRMVAAINQAGVPVAWAPFGPSAFALVGK